MADSDSRIRNGSPPKSDTVAEATNPGEEHRNPDSRVLERAALDDRIQGAGGAAGSLGPTATGTQELEKSETQGKFRRSFWLWEIWLRRRNDFIEYVEDLIAIFGNSFRRVVKKTLDEGEKTHSGVVEAVGLFIPEGVTTALFFGLVAISKALGERLLDADQLGGLESVKKWGFRLLLVLILVQFGVKIIARTMKNPDD